MGELIPFLGDTDEPDDTLEEAREAVAEDLDGQLMDLYDLGRIIEQHADLMRKSWHEDRLLLHIAFGMNDDDLMFTVSAYWE